MIFRNHFLLLAFLALSIGVRAEVIQTDICVYGATSGGIAAAIQAARMGKSVVLISNNDQVGGMTTAGLTAVDVGNASSIGGISAEFFKRVAARYNASGLSAAFESRIADEEFRAMLGAANVPLRSLETLSTVTKTGNRITQITMASGNIYRAKMFIDTTYEGDLMAAAGVSWTIGRESTATYGESLAGIGQALAGFQFNTAIDPYVVPGVPASGLLPGVQSGNGGVVGAADEKVQAYNYRLCLTNSSDPAKRVEISSTTAPGYSAADYEVLARHIAANPTVSLYQLIYFAALPNQKFDVNNNGPFSTDMVGGNYDYVAASPAQRAQIALNHRRYIEGLLLFLKTDPRVPAAMRSLMGTYAYAKDEFTATGGWPHQLYVREARRMISDYVMQQGNCAGARTVADSAGLASYAMDSHVVQRFAKLDGTSGARVYNDGVFYGNVPAPYPVSLRSLLPRQAECDNLAVPFALSASHVAFGSIRMEPIFMILSQTAVTTAAFAIDADSAVQAVPYEKVSAQSRADKQHLGGAAQNAATVIVDDADSGGVTVSGTWTNSANLSGFHGAGYKVSAGDGGAVNRTFRFTPTIAASGNYFVQLRWTASSNRATNVPVELIHTGGTFIKSINQQTDGGAWNSITGPTPVFLNAGTESSVLIRTAGTNGVVIVDAVRVVSATATVQIVASDTAAREINPSDTTRFTIVRDSGQTTNPWTVTYVVSGSASPGADYLALPGSVVIPAGEISASIPVTAISDSILEGSETVAITLLPTAEYAPGSLASATIQIVDQPLVQITATDAIARENVAGDSATFTVSRDAADTANAWTVTYSLSGTATAAADYVAPPGSVVIPVGTTSASITIASIADALAEGTETVTVTLDPNAAFAVAPLGQATASILDPPIDAWRAAAFTGVQLADPAISGDDGDPDADGIRNLTEYALGLDPNFPDLGATQRGWANDGRLTMTYLQRRTATDVSIIAEGTTNLSDWSSSGEMVQEIAREVQGEFDLVTIRLEPLNPDSGFLRVRVTRP